MFWIKKPPYCHKRQHRDCTLSSCFDKCYHSIVPNGSCGFILEYILNERQKLPISRRDDSYIDVNSPDFLKNLYDHVTNILINNNWKPGKDGDFTKKKYENMIQWLNGNNNFYSGKMLKNVNWLSTTELYLFLDNQNDYIIFTLTPDPKERFPYISDTYYLCDYFTEVSHEIRAVEKLLENPNLAALSDNHFFLISSNKSLISELQESILDLCRNFKMIFDLKPENEDFNKESFKNITFSRWGKNDSIRRRSYNK